MIKKKKKPNKDFLAAGAGNRLADLTGVRIEKHRCWKKMKIYVKLDCVV